VSAPDPPPRSPDPTRLPRPLRLERWALACYRLPYAREVRWADAVEEAGVFALLRLWSTDGAGGLAEGTVKATWSGVSPRSLGAVLEDVLLPRLESVDLADVEATARRLEAVPENRLARGMVETACWTLRAAAAGAPLWRLWGGEPRVDLTWTVTRQAPARMAAEAADMVARFGFATLKVKGGQSVATDLQALAEIRAAVGDGVRLYVDANGAYARAEAADYVARVAAAGATLAEDPCPLAPDAGFEALQHGAPIPILVDSGCETREDAALYLERGAVALSAKPGRVGLGESREIARLAQSAGARTVVGLYGESALGALVSLQQAAAIPADARAAAAEPTFFLLMRDQVLAEPLAVRAGAVTLPPAPDLTGLVDWDRIRRYAV
jgi:L-alanine-DL-glutamate epimerase-like enolase superfamily enzyme